MCIRDSYQLSYLASGRECSEASRFHPCAAPPRPEAGFAGREAMCGPTTSAEKEGLAGEPWVHLRKTSCAGGAHSLP